MNNNTEITPRSIFHCCIPNCMYPKGSFFRIPLDKTSEWSNLIKIEFPDFVYNKNQRICSRHFSHFNFSITHQKLLKFSKSYKEDSINLNRIEPGMSPGAEETALRLQSPEHVIEITTTEGLPSPLRESLEEIMAGSNVVNESLPASDLQDSRDFYKEQLPNEKMCETEVSEMNERVSDQHRVASIMKTSIRNTVCCVPTCPTSRRKNRNAHLFHFPKVKISDWENIIKAHHSDYVYKNNHRICTEHFSDSNFTSTLYNRLTKFASPDTFGKLPVRINKGINVVCSKKVVCDNSNFQNIDASKNNIDPSHDISVTPQPHPVETIPPTNTDSGGINIETTVGNASLHPQPGKAPDGISISSCNIVNSTASTSSSDNLNPHQGLISQNNLISSANTDQDTVCRTNPDLSKDAKTVAHNIQVFSSNVNELLPHRKNSPESHENIQEIPVQNDLVSSPIVNELDQYDSQPLITVPSKSHPKVNDSIENVNLHPPIVHSSETDHLKVSQNNDVLCSKVNRLQLLNPGDSKTDQNTILQNDVVLSEIVNDGVLTQTSTKKRSKKRLNEEDPNNITCCVPNCGISTVSNPEVHFFKFPQSKAMEWTRKIRSTYRGYSYKFHHKICQFHFSDSYFNSSSHNRLKNFALPSIFVNKNIL